MNFIDTITKLYQKASADYVFLIELLVGLIAFTLVYYFIIKFLVENNSGALVFIFIASMLLGAVIVVIASDMDPAIYMIIPCIFVLIICVLYSVELKRIIWARTARKIGDVKHNDREKQDKERISECITQIIKALQNMSKNDVGAIIVLANSNIPSQIIDSGVRLDGNISSELIESVFFPKTPLHDGAMIIDGTKVVAAGCFLPLSQKVDNIPKDLGTRHRAGIGVTETIDVMSIIVSEETGIISVARAGKITRYADSELLKKTLNKYYWQDTDIARR